MIELEGGIKTFNLLPVLFYYTVHIVSDNASRSIYSQCTNYILNFECAHAVRPELCTLYVRLKEFFCNTRARGLQTNRPIARLCPFGLNGYGTQKRYIFFSIQFALVC